MALITLITQVAQITLNTQVAQITLVAQTTKMRKVGIRFGVKNGSTRIGSQITLITLMALIPKMRAREHRRDAEYTESAESLNMGKRGGCFCMAWLRGLEKYRRRRGAGLVEIIAQMFWFHKSKADFLRLGRDITHDVIMNKLHP